MSEPVIADKTDATDAKGCLRLAAELHPLSPDPDSRRIVACAAGKYYQLGGLAAEVLRCVGDGDTSVDAVAKSLGRLYGRDVPTERLSDAVSQLCARGLLFGKGMADNTSGPRGRPSRMGTGAMGVRVQLLSPEMLRPITALCARLLSPLWVLRTLPVLVTAQAIFCVLYFHALLATGHNMRGMLFVWLVIGNYLGLLVHEMGHAAACLRSGVRHGSIGLAIYLVFPVLYTDVSEAWTLPPQRRMFVDAAGMYASLCAATVAAGLYLGTRSPVFGVLAVLYDLSVFMNLNPFIRMDAYWLFSDIIDVPDLMAENRSLTIWLFSRLLGIRSQRPRVLSLGTKLRKVYLAYYVLFLGFTALGGIWLLTWYPHLFVSIELSIRHIAAAVRVGGFSGRILRPVLGLAFRLVPVVGPLAYFARLVPRLVERTQGRL